MKTFMQYIAELSDSIYEVGQSVKVDRIKLAAKGIDMNTLGGFDYGKIVSAAGSTYELRFDNGAMIKVTADDILSVGDADATP